jgi:RNA polymerase sigma factor (TIGR02999 family)
MPAPSPKELTRLLQAWGGGDDAALAELIPMVHQELKRLARRYMLGERPGHTLQPTALVNEAYIKLLGCQQVQWQDRAHFLAVSAQLMRRILVDSARARGYQKRGAGVPKLTLDECLIGAQEKSKELTVLDDALVALAVVDPRKARVVELRYFGGLTAEETAEVLKISPDTVLRDWKLAKAWLAREMGKGRDNQERHPR